MKEVTGKGPEHIRIFVNQNLITVFAQGTLTPAEETLVNADRKESVRELRSHLQISIQDKFAEAIEDLTGIAVVSPLSDHAVDPDLSVYCFALERDLVDLLG